MRTNKIFKGKYWVKLETQTGEQIFSYKVDTLPQQTIIDAMKICDKAKVKNIKIDSLKNVTLELYYYP